MQSNHYYDDACWLFLYFAIIISDILDALRILAQYIHFGMSLYTGFVQINNWTIIDQLFTSNKDILLCISNLCKISTRFSRKSYEMQHVSFTQVHGQHTKLVNIKICLKNVGIYIINED